MRGIYMFIALAILLLSCRKKHDEGPCGNFPIPYSDLADLYFKTGSYWIYLDSITMTYDSAFVISNSSDYNGMKETCGKFQVNHFAVKHTYPSTFLDKIDVDKEGCFNNSSKIYVPFNSVENETTKYIRTYYDSLFIFDRYYKKVEKTIISSDYNENNNNSTYYINSDFGILRKDIFNGNGVLSKKFLIRKNILK